MKKPGYVANKSRTERADYECTCKSARPRPRVPSSDNKHNMLRHCRPEGRILFRLSRTGPFCSVLHTELIRSEAYASSFSTKSSAARTRLPELFKDPSGVLPFSCSLYIHNNRRTPLGFSPSLPLFLLFAPHPSSQVDTAVSLRRKPSIKFTLSLGSPSTFFFLY